MRIKRKKTNGKKAWALTAWRMKYAKRMKRIKENLDKFA